MRPDQLGADDGLELAAALMEHELDVAERLETSSEARLRLSDALRDRPDPTALERVQMEHAVRFPETKRAQHHGLGLVGAAGQVAQV
jgi:hypothetical protein